jgi:hypothetical protein
MSKDAQRRILTASECRLSLSRKLLASPEATLESDSPWADFADSSIDVMCGDAPATCEPREIPGRDRVVPLISDCGDSSRSLGLASAGAARATVPALGRGSKALGVVSSIRATRSFGAAEAVGAPRREVANFPPGSWLGFGLPTGQEFGPLGPVQHHTYGRGGFTAARTIVRKAPQTSASDKG